MLNAQQVIYNLSLLHFLQLPAFFVSFCKSLNTLILVEPRLKIRGFINITT